jgi:ribonucleoside-triphosphate reductase
MSGMWNGSETLNSNDPVGDVIMQGTLSVGFIGLAECLIALTGKHHGESEEAQKLGLKIVDYMNRLCKIVGTQENLNISLIATPAEGLSGKFVKKDRADFGVIPNVTDRDYYTNSNHVPVWYKCTMEHKMRVEAPYHELTPAGHIAYLEVDGDPEKNVKAVEQMVNLMRKYNVGYGSINHARARCLDCGYESGSDLFDVCPNCNSNNVDVLERITGYLVGGTNKWNGGKKAELMDRVSHMSGEKMLKDRQI